MAFIGPREGSISIPGCTAALDLPHGAGLPQGSPVSPVVFGLVMAAALRQAESQLPITIRNQVETYNYVDDMAWVSTDYTALRKT